MTCARATRCATYKRPIRQCQCARDERDANVLALLMIGAPIRQIKKEFRLKQDAVTLAVRRLCKKHGVKNRFELIVKAYRHALPKGAA